MKKEFQTKENLISNLTLDGRIELIGSADRLNISLEQYVESICFENKTASYWIDKELVRYKKQKDLYRKNDSLNQSKL